MRITTETVILSQNTNFKKKPLVSILMTTFAHENTIIKAIEGVVLQKCDFEIELIIANDCSPDSTDFKVKEYFTSTEIPDNITIFYTNHQANKGMIPNIGWALRQVKGKYTAICEGDDYWIDPLKLQKQVDFLESNDNYGLVHTNYKIFHAKTSQFSEHKTSSKENREDENAYYLKTGDIRTCTVVFRTSFLPNFKALMDQDFMKDTVIGDRPFFLLISKYSKIHFINDVTSVYYITAYNSASHFEDFFRYYSFLKKVSDTNISLLKYLDINDSEYIKDQERKINFYNVLLSFKHKKIGSVVRMLFSKTGQYFWNLNELKELYIIIRKNSSTNSTT